MSPWRKFMRKSKNEIRSSRKHSMKFLNDFPEILIVIILQENFCFKIATAAMKNQQLLAAYQNIKIISDAGDPTFRRL